MMAQFIDRPGKTPIIADGFSVGKGVDLKVIVGLMIWLAGLNKVAGAANGSKITLKSINSAQHLDNALTTSAWLCWTSKSRILWLKRQGSSVLSNRLCHKRPSDEGAVKLKPRSTLATSSRQRIHFWANWRAKRLDKACAQWHQKKLVSLRIVNLMFGVKNGQKALQRRENMMLRKSSSVCWKVSSKSTLNKWTPKTKKTKS